MIKRIKYENTFNWGFQFSWSRSGREAKIQKLPFRFLWKSPLPTASASTSASTSLKIILNVMEFFNLLRPLFWKVTKGEPMSLHKLCYLDRLTSEEYLGGPFPRSILKNEAAIEFEALISKIDYGWGPPWYYWEGDLSK